LSPENPFPIPINEAIAAYKWLLKSYNPANIALAGDSSGGSIVLSMLHIIQKEKLPNPACAIVMSPATDAHHIDEDAQSPQVRDHFIKHTNINFFVESYFQKTPRNHPVASPLYGPLRGFSPLFILADKNELMYGQSVRLAKKAKEQGVNVTLREAEGLWHLWPLFARHIPEAKASIHEIAQFVRQHTRN
jgi:monoterpene epsilon-lactone hydrolase